MASVEGKWEQKVAMLEMKLQLDSSDGHFWYTDNSW